jgi:hypothetical protein
MPGLSCNRTRVRLPRLTGLEDYFRVARQPESGLRILVVAQTHVVDN